MTLPDFNPHGIHGFTQTLRRGRLRHVPTYCPDDVADVHASYLETLPYTRKRIYLSAYGEVFAICNDHD